MDAIAVSPAPKQSSGSQSRRRRTITRGKTGCLTCRKRHKKCDERKPNCCNCEKNSLICEGYQGAKKWVPKASRSECTEMGGASDIVQDALVGQNLPAGFILEQLDIEPFLGSSTEADNGRVVSVDRLAEEVSPEPVLANQTSEIYGIVPELETSIPLPLEDPWPFKDPAESSPLDHDQNNDKWHSEIRFGTTRVTSGHQRSISRIPKAIPSLVDGIHTRLERRIFHHYISVVSRTLTLHTVEDKNPFTTLLIPLALANPGLLLLILSCSASHLSRFQEFNGIESDNPETRQIKEAKWTFYGDALKIHSKEMVPVMSPQQTRIHSSRRNNKDTGNIDLDTVLAMTMFMCQFDTCESGRDGIWRLHLNAAREIVRLQCKDKYPNSLSRDDPFNSNQQPSASRNCSSETRVSQFLLDWFFYHDVLASVTVPEDLPSLNIRSYGIMPYGTCLRETSLAEYYSAPRSSEVILIDRNDSFLSIIARIMDLHRRIKTMSLLESTSIDTFQCLDAEILDAGLAIAEELRNWSFSYNTFQQEIVAECDRWAAFILLYATIYPSKRRSPKIQSALEEGLFYMEQLVPTDNVQTCFLFPIFIFGVTAVEKIHYQVVKVALEAYNSWSALGNVNEVKEFLTQKWNGPREPTDDWWAWEKEIKDQNRCLVLV